MAKKKTSPDTIALNRKARHDYQIEETIEAGLVLHGWEVKSLRQGKIQLRDSHGKFLKDEAWMIGALITPLSTASTHVVADDRRTRKLLLKRKELSRIQGLIERKGYTLVVLSMYWKSGKVKASLGIARGRKQHDKREALKQQDWRRDKARLVSNSLRRG